MSSAKHDIQNVVFQASQKFKELEKHDYIGHCIVCKKVLDRGEMVYQNNYIFHPLCFDQHASEYQETSLTNEQRGFKINLANLKNLQVRISNQNSRKTPSSTHKKKSSKKPKKKKTRTKKRKAKTKRRVSKRKTKRSKTKKRRTKTKKKRSSKKRSVKRRRPKRRTSKRKVRRSKKRKSKRRR
ncbi:MAG: hypothetical protein ACE5EJ_00085 [Nitrosopumilaceae archaeon]